MFISLFCNAKLVANHYFKSLENIAVKMEKNDADYTNHKTCDDKQIILFVINCMLQRHTNEHNLCIRFIVMENEHAYYLIIQHFRTSKLFAYLFKTTE